MRARCQLFRAALAAHRRDVERAQVAATKSHHGRTTYRQQYLTQDFPAWRQLQQAAAFIHRAPVIAFSVNRRTVRSAAVLRIAFHRELTQNAASADSAAVQV